VKAVREEEVKLQGERVVGFVKQVGFKLGVMYNRCLVFTRAMLCLRGISCDPVSVFLSVCLSVCLSVTSRSFLKTAERIELWHREYPQIIHTLC